MTRAPGEILVTLARLNAWRKWGWRVSDLPRSAQDELHAFLSDCRAYVARDPQGAISVEEILNRIDADVDKDRLGTISSGDTKRLGAWLRQLPTAVRGAA